MTTVANCTLKPDDCNRQIFCKPNVLWRCLVGSQAIDRIEEHAWCAGTGDTRGFQVVQNPINLGILALMNVHGRLASPGRSKLTWLTTCNGPFEPMRLGQITRL